MPIEDITYFYANKKKLRESYYEATLKNKSLIEENKKLKKELREANNEILKLKNPSVNKLMEVLEDLGVEGYNLSDDIVFYKNIPIRKDCFGAKFFLDKKDNLIIKHSLEEVIEYLNKENN